MTQPPPMPETCCRTLAAVEADPLEPGPEAEGHLRSCRACAEARVAYLAQEEPPEALAPSGYYDRLPDRILRKLPARPRILPRLHPLAWGAAAALLMAVGAGAFWAGRANRTPLVEATLTRQPELTATSVSVSDTPFQDREEEAAQVQTLTPEEMKALLNRLDAPQSTQR